MFYDVNSALHIAPSKIIKQVVKADKVRLNPPARRAVNIAFGVHLPEKIMKIVNRLARIGRPGRRFGGFGNRMMLESV